MALMPMGKMHRQRLGRNLALAGILVAFIVGLFVYTMINFQSQIEAIK